MKRQTIDNITLNYLENRMIDLEREMWWLKEDIKEVKRRIKELKNTK